MHGPGWLMIQYRKCSPIIVLLTFKKENQIMHREGFTLLILCLFLSPCRKASYMVLGAAYSAHVVIVNQTLLIVFLLTRTKESNHSQRGINITYSYRHAGRRTSWSLLPSARILLIYNQQFVDRPYRKRMRSSTKKDSHQLLLSLLRKVH